MSNFKGVLLIAALALGLPMGALAQTETAESEAADSVEVSAETVLATVGDIEITLGHLIAAVEDLSDEERNLPNDVLLNGLTVRLTQQAAIAATATEMSQAMKLRLDNERSALIAGEILGEVANAIEVTDEDIQSAYDARFADFTPGTEYNASHILVETEEEAKALVTELEGGADFAELAKEKSTGPSGSNGGNLNWFARGMMVDAFQDAVETLEVGGISVPIKTQFGWHVIKLNETRIPEVPVVEQMADELRNDVFQLKLRQSMEAMVDAAQIERVDLSGINPAVVRDGSLIGR